MPGIVIDSCDDRPYGPGNPDYEADKWRDEQDEKERTKMKNDGGPAFPIPAVMPSITSNGMGNTVQTFYQPPQSGMSLRDWFAGKALQGWVASDRHLRIDWTGQEVAANCYKYADAMLAERAKE